MKIEEAAALCQKIIGAVEQAIIGKRDIIEKTLVALLCNGHVLLEDVPGVGKTTLAKAFAKVLDCSFRRIQCTPDLLPSDVTGSIIYNLKTGDFVFKPGPVFANIVLVDEINRISPKTQSSLLECMDEFQVTTDGVTHRLPAPFMLIATQNPLEHEGIFSLPESQTDRFLLSLKMGYPGKEEEKQIVWNQRLAQPVETLSVVASKEDVLALQEVVRNVQVHERMQDYILDLVRLTRQDERVQLGASPRGSLFLFRAAQAKALISGRDFILPDDVKSLAVEVLAHRLLLAPSARLEGITPQEVVLDLLNTVPVPDASWR